MELNAADVKLTDLASCGGCASKYSAARLSRSCAGFVPVEAENLLVGLAPSDDAAVYKLDDERALDLHARLLPADRRRPGRLRVDRGDERAERRLRDGRDAAARALDRRVPRGAPDRDARRRSSRPRTSRSAPRAASSPAGTRFATRSRSTASRSSAPSTRTESGRRLPPSPATRLYVTKPLGTGLIMTGHKKGEIGTQQLERAVRWMKTLNKDAAEVAARAQGRTRSPTSPASASSGTSTRWPSGAASGSRSSRSASRRSTGRSTSPARASARAGDPRNRDFAGRAL